MRRKQIVVIGESDTKKHLDDAYEIGKFIAKNNYVLITGGRGGIMEAASRGAAENNGTVIGILPGSDFYEANKYCNIVIPTGIGYARNMINILSADILIALTGKAGTLSELVYAWQYNKPIICCTFAEGWSKKITDEPIDDRKGSKIFEAENLNKVFNILLNEL